MTDAIDPDLIERGRKMFAGDWHFIWASPSIETLPPMGSVEIAFAGRSNVGKSSLINALTGRNAHVSGITITVWCCLRVNLVPRRSTGCC